VKHVSLAGHQDGNRHARDAMFGHDRLQSRIHDTTDIILCLGGEDEEQANNGCANHRMTEV
jgi:hypothetical protein